MASADPIPFNDLRRLYLRFERRVETAAIKAMRSGWWLSGMRVEAFSEAFSEMIGAKYCLPVANGTDALELALRVVANFSDPERKEVLTAANAGGYSTTAAHIVGLTPVYVDIDESTQLISSDSVVTCLSKRTLAVVVTHLYGGVVDVPKLRRELDRAGYSAVPIVEDCAQAHGARFGDAVAGSMGAISTFSFYPTKNLGALGDAGAVLTSSADYFEALKQLHQYGWDRKYHTVRAGGRNSRMDEVQAAVLSTLLPELPSLNAERAAIVNRYRSIAPPGIRFTEAAPGSVAHLAVLLSDHRDQLQGFLGQRAIATEVHYPTLDCDQIGWRSLEMKIEPENLATSRRSVPKVLSLPCFIGMTQEEVDSVCLALEAFSPR
jgi:dTDP-4-amino-4,6-dideoxygalactose transaminase